MTKKCSIIKKLVLHFGLMVLILCHFCVYGCGDGTCYVQTENGSECNLCSAGTYSTGGDCIETETGQGFVCPGTCSSGTYSGNQAGSCTQCPAGQYQPNSGATGCDTCPAGSYSTEGSAECTYSCPTGEGVNSGTSSQSASVDQCGTCNAGYYNTGSSIYCTACPVGEFSVEGASSCVSDCAAGNGVQSGVSSQSTSPTECELCNAGYYNDGSSNYCLACPSGSFSSVGAANCSFSCPAGSGVESGTSSQSTSTEVCGMCNPAYANNGTSIYCQACAVDTVASAGASVCSSTCEAGNGVEHGSSSQSTSSELCGYCETGYVNNGTSIYCTVCPAGQISLPAVGGTRCGLCPAGSGVAFAASSSSTSSEVCAPCSLDYYNPGDSIYCSQCPSGTITLSTNASTCSFCPAGTGVAYASTSQSLSTIACGLCNVGFHNNGSSIYCETCPANSAASTVGESTCSACNPGTGVQSGTSSNSTSVNTCSACSAGYFQSGTGTVCQACPTDYVSNGVASSECISICAAGQGVLSGTSSLSSSVEKCGSCASGYANNGTSLYCEACPMNSAANVVGSHACTVCGAGTAANALSAATDCAYTCPPGTGIYSDYSAQSDSSQACGLCNIGYYQSGGDEQCQQCTATQYTKTTGAESYLTCSYPKQSYFYNLDGSGKYHACGSICIGVSTLVLAICMSIVGFITLLCFLLVKNKDGNTDYHTAFLLFIYCFIPIFDVFTDIAYILTEKYYNWLLFILSSFAIVIPSVVFFNRLLHRGAIAKFHILTMPDYLFFSEYDNLFKIIITAIVSLPFVLVNLPITLPLILMGCFFNATKVIAITSISNQWYYFWTGSRNFEKDENNVIDTHVLNESIYTSIFYQSFFHLFVQIANNTLMNRWSILAALSIAFSGLNTLNGVYLIAYFKLYRKEKLIDQPVKMKLGGIIRLPLDIQTTKSPPNTSSTNDKYNQNNTTNNNTSNSNNNNSYNSSDKYNINNRSESVSSIVSEKRSFFASFGFGTIYSGNNQRNTEVEMRHSTTANPLNIDNQNSGNSNSKKHNNNSNNNGNNNMNSNRNDNNNIYSDPGLIRVLEQYKTDILQAIKAEYCNKEDIKNEIKGLLSEHSQSQSDANTQPEESAQHHDEHTQQATTSGADVDVMV